jgi:hypothetical protein
MTDRPVQKDGVTSDSIREWLDYLESIGIARESLDGIADILDYREIGYKQAVCLAAFTGACASRLGFSYGAAASQEKPKP